MLIYLSCEKLIEALANHGYINTVNFSSRSHAHLTDELVLMGAKEIAPEAGGEFSVNMAETRLVM